MNETFAKFAIVAAGCFTTWYLLVHSVSLPPEVPLDQAGPLLLGLAVTFGPAVWLVGCLLYMVLDVK